MKINIDFIFTCESDDWKIEKLVWRLAQKLKNYQTGETWIFKRVYRIEQDDKLYHEVVETYEKYKTEINFKILDFNVELNEEEVKEAVAFIPIWPNEFCEEYDDVSYKYKQCDLCGSSLSISQSSSAHIRAYSSSPFIGINFTRYVHLSAVAYIK